MDDILIKMAAEALQLVRGQTKQADPYDRLAAVRRQKEQPWQRPVFPTLQEPSSEPDRLDFPMPGATPAPARPPAPVAPPATATNPTSTPAPAPQPVPAAPAEPEAPAPAPPPSGGLPLATDNIASTFNALNSGAQAGGKAMGSAINRFSSMRGQGAKGLASAGMGAMGKPAPQASSPFDMKSLGSQAQAAGNLARDAWSALGQSQAAGQAAGKPLGAAVNQATSAVGQLGSSIGQGVKSLFGSTPAAPAAPPPTPAPAPITPGAAANAAGQTLNALQSVNAAGQQVGRGLGSAIGQVGQQIGSAAKGLATGGMQTMGKPAPAAPRPRSSVKAPGAPTTGGFSPPTKLASFAVAMSPELSGKACHNKVEEATSQNLPVKRRRAYTSEAGSEDRLDMSELAKLAAEMNGLFKGASFGWFLPNKPSYAAGPVLAAPGAVGPNVAMAAPSALGANVAMTGGASPKWPRMPLPVVSAPPTPVGAGPVPSGPAGPSVPVNLGKSPGASWGDAPLSAAWRRLKGDSGQELDRASKELARLLGEKQKGSEASLALDALIKNESAQRAQLLADAGLPARAGTPHGTNAYNELRTALSRYEKLHQSRADAIRNRQVVVGEDGKPLNDLAERQAQLEKQIAAARAYMDMPPVPAGIAALEAKIQAGNLAASQLAKAEGQHAAAQAAHRRGGRQLAAGAAGAVGAAGTGALLASGMSPSEAALTTLSPVAGVGSKLVRNGADMASSATKAVGGLFSGGSKPSKPPAAGTGSGTSAGTGSTAGSDDKKKDAPGEPWYQNPALLTGLAAGGLGLGGLALGYGGRKVKNRIDEDEEDEDVKKASGRVPPPGKPPGAPTPFNPVNALNNFGRDLGGLLPSIPALARSHRAVGATKKLPGQLEADYKHSRTQYQNLAHDRQKLQARHDEIAAREAAMTEKGQQMDGKALAEKDRLRALLDNKKDLEHFDTVKALHGERAQAYDAAVNAHQKALADRSQAGQQLWAGTKALGKAGLGVAAVGAGGVGAYQLGRDRQNRAEEATTNTEAAPAASAQSAVGGKETPAAILNLARQAREEIAGKEPTGPPKEPVGPPKPTAAQTKALEPADEALLAEADRGGVDPVADKVWRGEASGVSKAPPPPPDPSLFDKAWAYAKDNPLPTGAAIGLPLAAAGALGGWFGGEEEPRRKKKRRDEEKEAAVREPMAQLAADALDMNSKEPLAVKGPESRRTFNEAAAVKGPEPRRPAHTGREPLAAKGPEPRPKPKTVNEAAAVKGPEPKRPARPFAEPRAVEGPEPKAPARASREPLATKGPEPKRVARPFAEPLAAEGADLRAQPSRVSEPMARKGPEGRRPSRPFKEPLAEEGTDLRAQPSRVNEPRAVKGPEPRRPSRPFNEAMAVEGPEPAPRRQGKPFNEALAQEGPEPPTRRPARPFNEAMAVRGQEPPLRRPSRPFQEPLAQKGPAPAAAPVFTPKPQPVVPGSAFNENLARLAMAAPFAPYRALNSAFGAAAQRLPGAVPATPPAATSLRPAAPPQPLVGPQRPRMFQSFEDMIGGGQPTAQPKAPGGSGLSGALGSLSSAGPAGPGSKPVAPTGVTGSLGRKDVVPGTTNPPPPAPGLFEQAWDFAQQRPFITGAMLGMPLAAGGALGYHMASRPRKKKRQDEED